MQLRTERLIIRTAESCDAEFIAGVLTNKKVQKYTGGVSGTYEDTLSKIKNTQNSLENYYLITLSNNNISIGFVLFIENYELNDHEIYIALMPDYCGDRYGPETLVAMTNYWLLNNKRNHMYATVAERNRDSISMLERSGYKFIKKYKPIHLSTQLVYKFENTT